MTEKRQKKNKPNSRASLVYLCPSKKELVKHIHLITDATNRHVGFYEVTPTPDSQYGPPLHSGKFITSSACPKNLSIRIPPADFDIYPADFINDYLFGKMLACYAEPLRTLRESGVIQPAHATPNQQELEMLENSRKAKNEPYWVERTKELVARIEKLEKDNEKLRQEKKQSEENWKVAHRNNDFLRERIHSMETSSYRESILIQNLQKEREQLFSQVNILQARRKSSEKALTTGIDELRKRLETDWGWTAPTES